MSVTSPWFERAACLGVDPEVFHAKTAGGQQAAIRDHCRSCPVRADCLADALASPADQDHGVRGGKTRKQRQELRQRPDLPTGRDAVTIAALRRLLDAEQPGIPRHPNPRPKHRAPKEPTMHETTTPTPVPAEPEKAATIEAERAAAPEAAAPVRSISDLLTWAEHHPQAAIRKHASKAREALTAIQQRHAVDAELDQVQQEVERARKRLATLEARAKELARPGARATPQRDWDPATVRAWAKERSLPCPAFGQIPKAVVQAWRERDAA